MKKVILGFYLLSVGCTKTSAPLQEGVGQYPLNKERFEMLRWDLTPEELTSQCHSAQETLKQEIESIIKTQNPNLENTLEKADKAFTRFGNEQQPLGFYSYVYNDAALKEASKTCTDESEQLHLSIFSRPDFYKIIKTAAAKQTSQSEEQKRLLKDYMYSFKVNGLLLSEAKRQQLFKLRTELINIQSTFSQVLTTWNEKLHFSKDELEGLPEGILSGLEKSNETGKDYVLTLKYPHVIPALKYVKKEEIRKTIYKAFKNRGGKENSKRLAQAIDLRLKIAKILGYKDFASYRQDDNMAKDPATVSKFLGDLQKQLRERAKEEFARLLDLKRKDLKNPRLKTLNPWDESYYDTMLMKEKYAVSEEEIKPYFPAYKTVDGMLKIYQTILGVDFQNLPKARVWHPDVKAFQVVDHKTGQIIGQFYMDLFPRDGKFSHAANFGLINGYEKEEGSYVLPISAVVANFSKPTQNDPGLLDHNEVETLFHEFGHVMHHVLSRAKYGNFSGTNVKRDFVEAPSQMMESWVWEKSILKDLSSHYKTGESMPDELIDRLLRTRTYNKGIFYTRQIFYASIDMAYHTLKKTKGLDVTKLYHQLYHDIYLLNPLAGTRPEAAFDHLMGGYEAGYYGYLWSEVYACDMYTRFEQEGLLNASTGQEYRKTILEQGGSKDPMDLVVSFLKRKPNNKAFLRLMQ